MIKKTSPEPRNWGLVVIALIYLVIGLALIAAAIVFMPVFGWFSLLIGLAGATPVVASIISIVKNDPSWILLDLIIPG